jgi:hypothetical protein
MAVEADFAQALEDLLHAVRVRIEPAHHLRLEGIEPAGAAAIAVAGTGRP